MYMRVEYWVAPSTLPVSGPPAPNFYQDTTLPTGHDYERPKSLYAIRARKIQTTSVKLTPKRIRKEDQSTR